MLGTLRKNCLVNMQLPPASNWLKKNIYIYPLKASSFAMVGTLLT